MRVHDIGSGPPLVLVPGIQGRWEWMRPAVDALAQRFRVITFSLADERSSGAHFDASRGFESYLDQVRDAMDIAGVDRAAICGVSYGGLIAAAFAARNPQRVSALVLVSALPPDWRANRRAQFYLRAPRLLAPLFAAASLRLYREMHRAYGHPAVALPNAIRHGWNVVTHPGSPVRMARRIRLLDALDLEPVLARLNTHTLVITGEDELDDVVPPAETRKYLTLWPHATGVVLSRTGHLGLITRPDEAARLIADFVTGAQESNAERRRIG
jgi:pimeloyl-ACP methyl ester carboxylesterase